MVGDEFRARRKLRVKKLLQHCAAFLRRDCELFRGRNVGIGRAARFPDLAADQVGELLLLQRIGVRGSIVAALDADVEARPVGQRLHQRFKFRPLGRQRDHGAGSEFLKRKFLAAAAEHRTDE